MKVILEPKVTVVGLSQFVEHPDYQIPIGGSDACKIGSFAAKGCYDSYGEQGRSNEANQEAILESKHGSVLEHATVSLFVEGVTRALTLEMNRHRLFAISQRSTRYTKEEDAAIVLEPYYANLYLRHILQYTCIDTDIHAAESKLIRGHLRTSEDAFDSYVMQVNLLEQLNPLGLKGFDLRKWARGKARNILPHCLETRATYTANHRAWRWFIELRSGVGAEAEIRRLANVVLEKLKTIAPEYYDDFEKGQVYDGIPEWKPKYSKV